MTAAAAEAAAADIGANRRRIYTANAGSDCRNG